MCLKWTKLSPRTHLPDRHGRGLALMGSGPTLLQTDGAMNPVTGAPTAVDYLLAIASLLGAVAWPVTVLVLVLMFRRPLRTALADLVQLRWGSTELKFRRAAGEVSASLIEPLIDSKVLTLQTTASPARPALHEYYADLADENPLSAIIKAYESIEVWFDEALSRFGIANRDGNRKIGAMQMARRAVNEQLLPASSLHTIEGLGIMRDLAIQHGDERVTPAAAKEFLILTDGLLYSLDSELEKSRPDS